tara:strand:- start:624 stop:1178 length:555 start_codon:yes stop_codon:yes gene_type:complete
VKKQKNTEDISEIELSLIAAISGLDNKLEELDHNLSMLSDRGSNLKQPLIDLNKINSKIKELEAKIERISQQNSSEKTSTDESYLKIITSQSRSTNKRKGYVVADNLRLKRIEIIERTLAGLLKKSHNDTNPLSNDSSQQKIIQYKVSPEEFYIRSRGIFFGFIFSISIVFLLIIVSTGTNIFI